MSTLDSYSIPGSKTMLVGETGTGKTHSISTLVEAGIKPFIIFTEPGMSTIAKALKFHNLNPDDIEWAYVPMQTASWDTLLDMAKKINTMSYEAITKMSDPNKSQYTQWYKIMSLCADFVSDKDGQHYGDITTWNTDRALCIDSLSGLNTMAMALVVGGRPTRAMNDWMVAQNNLEGFLDKLTTDLACHFVLTAHLEQEKNEVTGGIQLMASTLGKKLGPKIPKNFDDVIHCERIGDKFTWSTVTYNVSLKARHCALAKDITPSFVPLIENWKANGGVILPTETGEQKTQII